MSVITSELLQISERFESLGAKGEALKIDDVLKRLDNAAEQVEKSWCGSALGYHSRVYYQNLQPVPPGARFSQEWGFARSTGNWAEYDFEKVVEAIFKMAGNPDLSAAEAFVQTVRVEAKDLRTELLSLLSTELQTYNDPFLVQLQGKIETYKFYKLSDFLKSFLPSGQFISRDDVAIQQGIVTSPHHGILANVITIRFYLKIGGEFAKIAKQAASHISRRELKQYEQKAREIKDRNLDEELRKVQIDGIKLQLIDQTKNLNKLRKQAATHGSLSNAPLNVQNEIERIETHVAELVEELRYLEDNS